MIRLRESTRKLRLRDCCAGRNAEAVAVSMLRLNEYCVLARDCRAEVLELDIVGRRSWLLVIVAAKRHPNLRQRLEAMTER